MPVPLSDTADRWRACLAGSSAATGPVTGMWVASGSPVVAEICAGSGVDWLLIDSEHAPNDPGSILPQLQAVAPYPVTPVVRPPAGEPVIIKQLLDLGVEVLLIPMVESAAQARALVAATRYPPDGIRGVGSALARASRWNRVSGYLANATQTVSLLVQVESRAGLSAISEIAVVDGVDGVFLGPADLAAALGHLGQQDHPEVTGAVEAAIKAVTAAGKPAGVNAFPRELADRYLEAGARFILVGADVTLLAAGSEQLAGRHRPAD
jgi:4-hydroxy-2-oxoheptanedioate aldolase